MLVLEKHPSGCMFAVQCVIDINATFALTFKAVGDPACFLWVRSQRRTILATYTSSRRGAYDGVPMLSSNAQADRFGEVVMPHLADALSLARWLTGNATD